MLEHALTVANFGDKNHLHGQVLAQVVQDLTHIFINQFITLVGGGQQQLADLNLQCLWCVIPIVNSHLSNLGLRYKNQTIVAEHFLPAH